MWLWLTLSTPLQAQERVMLGVQPGAQAAWEAPVAALGGQLLRCWGALDICLVGFPGAAPLEALRGLPGLRWATPDRPMDLAPRAPGGEPPRPPPFADAGGTVDCPDLWELDTLRAETLWEQATGQDAPWIAVQDSGFLSTHLELTDAIGAQYDFGDDDPTAEVSAGSGVPAHGTFIAGLVAADPDNGRGRAGLAPRSQIYAQKIADATGALYYSYAVDAMNALLEGDIEVGVLSYSLASSYADPAMGEAIAALQEADILVVAAAGNCLVPDCVEGDNDQDPLYPGSFGGPAMLVVAGTDRADAFNPYSHFGAASVHLAAPGVDLCSLGVGSTTAVEVASGTSYATPLVAAAAALVREAHPALSAPEVGQVLLASTWPLAELEGLVLSGGRLDPVEALAAAVPRLGLPAALALSGAGTLTLTAENPGAAGDLWVLVEWDRPLRPLRLEAPEGWQLTEYTAGTALSLPDLGPTQATLPGVILRGALGEGEQAALTLHLRSLGDGEGALQVRALGLGGTRAVVRWPYSGPSQLTEAAPTWSTVPLSATAGDTAVDSGVAEDKGGRCAGCGSAPQSPAWTLALGALLALRRRATGAARPRRP